MPFDTICLSFSCHDEIETLFRSKYIAICRRILTSIHTNLPFWHVLQSCKDISCLTEPNTFVWNIIHGIDHFRYPKIMFVLIYNVRVAEFLCYHLGTFYMTSLCGYNVMMDAGGRAFWVTLVCILWTPMIWHTFYNGQ